MASSSRAFQGNKGKEVIAARTSDLASWITDEETRTRFLNGLVKSIAPPKYLSHGFFKREGFAFPS